MGSPVLVFDKPLSNLDYPSVKKVLTAIVDLHKKGHTIIIFTHDLSKCLAHANKMIILNKGKVAGSGKPEHLIHKLEDNNSRMPRDLNIGEMTWLK